MPDQLSHDIVSYFPTADTSIPERECVRLCVALDICSYELKVCRESQRPELTQTNLIDVFLFRTDSQQQILQFCKIPSPTEQTGFVHVQVNDSQFGEQGNNRNCQDISYPY